MLWGVKGWQRVLLGISRAVRPSPCFPWVKMKGGEGEKFYPGSLLTPAHRDAYIPIFTATTLLQVLCFTRTTIITLLLGSHSLVACYKAIESKSQYTQQNNVNENYSRKSMSRLRVNLVTEPAPLCLSFSFGLTGNRSNTTLI